MLYHIDPLWNNGKQRSNKSYRNVVVFGTYNRAHLMMQSMHAYCCSMDAELDAIVVLDDGSTDETFQVCELSAQVLDIFYFKLQDKAPGEWRDSAAFLNMGISFAIYALNALRVIPTHPEIVPGIHTFVAINAAPEGIDFVMFRGYYLTVELQLRYEAFMDWVKTMRESEPDWSIRHFKALCPDFYDYGDKNHNFHPNNLEADTRAFDSWIFCAATSNTWKRFKGMPESSNWGTVDIAFMNQRPNFGFTIATPNEIDTWVLHQNHDDPTRNVLTPRVEEVWRADMKANHDQYTTIESKPDYLNPERWKP
jgi:hypothetical protein